MKSRNQPQPPEPPPRVSAGFARQEHRKDTRTFLWGTGLLLLVAFGLAVETLQGLRSGQWVDIGGEQTFLVPGWIAAAVTLGVLAASLWCYSRYVHLKDSAATFPPQEGTADDE